MEKFCFKESSRVCNDSCQAYCEFTRHGTNCLELATQVEVGDRIPGLIASNDLNAFYLKTLTTVIHSLKDHVQGMTKIL